MVLHSSPDGDPGGVSVNLPVVLEDSYPNAIACASLADAIALTGLMGLDPKQWKALQIGESIEGRRFHKAIVMHGPSSHPFELQSKLAWINLLQNKASKVIVL